MRRIHPSVTGAITFHYAQRRCPQPQPLVLGENALQSMLSPGSAYGMSIYCGLTNLRFDKADDASGE